MYNIVVCCRACLRSEPSLTHTSSLDNDNIRILDKLTACVSNVTWQRQDYPVYICSICIEKLRVSYDFRNMCVQSDGALQRYFSHLQVPSILKQVIVDRPLQTPTKFEFGIQTDNLPNTLDERTSTDFLSLRHFLEPNAGIQYVNKVPNCTEATGRTVACNGDNTCVYTDNSGAANAILSGGHDVEILTVEAEGVGTLNDCLSGVAALQIENSVKRVTSNQNVAGALEDATTSNDDIVQNKAQDVGKVTGKVNTETQTPLALLTQSNKPIPSMEKPAPKRYPCNVCGKDYSNYSNLRSHKKSHSGEKPYECKYCDKRFLHPHHLREHIRRHTGEKPFACSLCNKRFTIRGEVTMHMRSHTGEKPYSCTYCDKRCSTHSDLKVHIRTHTGEKPFECGVCSKKFASAYILNSHTKTHTGEKPFECSFCHKKFAQSSQLTVHFRTHTGEKPYVCDHCGKRYPRNTELTIHMREHTGKVPYSCSICNRGFVYQSHYQAHMIKHSGEKPYVCVTCDKKFTTASYLQEHSRKHTGQKLFSCTHCEKTFTRPAFLTKHLRKHTGEKPFVCGICSRRFSSSNYLATHMKKHSNVSTLEDAQSLPQTLTPTQHVTSIVNNTQNNQALLMQ